MNGKRRKITQLKKFDPNQVWETLVSKKQGDAYSTSVIHQAIDFKVVHSDEANISPNPTFSLPIILDGEKSRICFLLSSYSKTGDRISSCLPSLLVSTSVESLNDIKFSTLVLEKLSLKLPLRTDEPILKNHKLISSNYHGKGISAQSVQAWKTEFYELTDYAISRYCRQPEQLTQIEREKLSRYAELFKALSWPSFIPIYKAINPSLFKWLDAVFQPQIETEKHTTHDKVEPPSYYTVNDRPVKMVSTPNGGRDVLALNIITGEFERDMSYLSRCFDPGQDVDSLSEEQFEQLVQTIRSSRQ